MGDELGGHLVTGHVDGIADIIGREDLPDMARLAVHAPTSLARFIAPKGSVALDSVSLTVNAVEGNTFSTLIIPHTLDVTTLGAIKRAIRSTSRSTSWRAMRRGSCRPVREPDLVTSRLSSPGQAADE